MFREEEAALRANLIRTDLLECVIGLGPNLFFNAPMEACIVICRSVKRQERQRKVLFINAVDEVTRKKLEIDLVSLIHRHEDDERFIALGKRVEELRLRVESGLLSSIEFVKSLLDLAKEAAQMERAAEPEASEERGKAALTKLFESVRSESTPVIVERLVNDIDAIVKIVRFPGWKDSSEGRKTVKRTLREVIMVKYKIRDRAVFDKAYGYVEQYY